MISSTIKKRTQSVNKQIKEKWCEEWMDYIERHPEHPWNWYGISQSENLTMDYVERHPEHHWDHTEIFWNVFEKKQTFIEKIYKEHLSAFKIQQWFYSIKLNPTYKYCRKQVNMFYDATFVIV